MGTEMFPEDRANPLIIILVLKVKIVENDSTTAVNLDVQHMSHEYSMNITCTLQSNAEGRIIAYVTVIEIIKFVTISLISSSYHF